MRADIDAPVAINDLKRFVVEWANAQPEFPYRPTREPDHEHSVAIVGAGPAGLAAAHDLRLRGYSVTLLDANDEPGGLLLTGIPRYRLPLASLRGDVARILELGVHFEGGRRLGTDLHLRDLVRAHSAVILTIGAQTARTFDLPGAPTSLALDFLRQTRSNAGSNQGRRFVVIGGGNSAVDAARTALRTGAARVSVACLESRDEMPAIAEEIHEAEREGVEFHTRVQVTRWTDSGVELIGVVPRKRGDFNVDNFAAVADTEQVIEADEVIVAIGQLVADHIGDRADPELARTPSGALVIDQQTGATSHCKIFAGGDVTSAHTVTDAIADGLRAAWGIDQSLRGPEAASTRLPPPRVSAKPTRRRTHLDRIDRRPRVEAPMLAPGERIAGFHEVTTGLSEQAAREEARRCMICGQCGNCRACLDLFGCPAFRVSEGRIVIDPELCTGCGVCADFCPNGAIVPKGTN